MKNKVVLITGSAKRIGAAIAQYLHQCGMDIILHYHHSKDEAEQLQGILNSTRPDSAFTIQGDLLDESGHSNLINQALKCRSRLDVLINNASVFYSTPLDKSTHQQWHDLVDVNLKAPYFLIKEAASEIRKRKGCIINLVDIHGSKPLKDYSIYSISKAGLVMLTKSLARELAPDVRINAIAPGAISWPEEMSEKEKTAILNRILLKRKGEEYDVAKATAFLINDANYITGQVLTIDGGRSIYS